ncbi:hypothetical protein AgCh_019083 [Apium graveolens]
MKRKNGGQEGEVALKLDISKAYDRVRWDFLRSRMRLMGFSERWIKWIMLCVTTVSYSISFQGSMVGPIMPGRGLRQGDPISPYLFLLCVEGLSLALKSAATRGIISGCCISNSAPSVTHLLFADDSFLFFKATSSESQAIKEVLNSYEAASGQAVNFQKSAVFFSANVRRDKQEEIKQVLGVFNDIGERKAVMIRNVAQMIPAYTMSCFLIPKGLCQEIERLMNAYWWKSSSPTSKPICWLAWNKMSMSKSKGGLGFRDLHGFNLALLGKQCWNLMSKPNALVSRVLKAKYYPDCHLLQARRSGGSSYTWSGIWEAKEELKTGLRWVLGDGQTINVRSDRWLRNKDDFCVDQSSTTADMSTKVCEFFRADLKSWDVTKVKACFNQADADAILSTRIPRTGTKDRVAWCHSSDGKYTVKTGYQWWHKNHVGELGLQQSKGWSNIWRLNVPHKIKIFLWRFCRNNVPVRNLLRHRGARVPIGCNMCVEDIEHLAHLFFDCHFARACWQIAGLEYEMGDVENVPEWLLNKLRNDTAENLGRIAAVLWGVWFARNKRIFENKYMSPATTMNWSMTQIKEWRDANIKRQATGLNERGAMHQQNRQWVKPEPGCRKLNVDAAVKEGQNSFSVGLVLRDDRGQYIAGKTCRFAGSLSVEEAETVAILEGLLWTNELPPGPITIESDSLLSINAIRKGSVNFLEIGHLVQHCRSLINSREGVSVVFTRKQANKAAHILARHPCELNSFVINLSPPLCLLETLLSDALII